MENNNKNSNPTFSRQSSFPRSPSLPPLPLPPFWGIFCVPKRPMEGPALRTGLGGFRGALHGRLGQPSSGEPRLITPGASLAGGDQEQSKCQTAARSHPSGAIRLSPFAGRSGRSGEVQVVDRGFRSPEDLPPPDSQFLRVARDKGFQEVPRQDPELPSRHVSWEDRGRAAV